MANGFLTLTKTEEARRRRTSGDGRRRPGALGDVPETHRRRGDVRRRPGDVPGTSGVRRRPGDVPATSRRRPGDDPGRPRDVRKWACDVRALPGGARRRPGDVPGTSLERPCYAAWGGVYETQKKRETDNSVNCKSIIRHGFGSRKNKCAGGHVPETSRGRPWALGDVPGTFWGRLGDVYRASQHQPSQVVQAAESFSDVFSISSPPSSVGRAQGP